MYIKQLITILLFATFVLVSSYSRAGDVPVTSLADAGPGTLRQAIADAAPGDRVVLSTSVYGQSILPETPILIDKAVYIQGRSKTDITVDGQQKTRLFIVDAPDQLVRMGGFTLTRGFAEGSGGAIQVNSGYLRLEGMSITDSEANAVLAGGGGGAISNRDSLTIHESRINYNRATGSFGAGGAVLNGPGGWCSTSSTRLIGNQADRSGGALQEYAVAGNYLSLHKTTIDSNYTHGSGGALRLEGPGVRNSTIGQMKNNRAGQEGGAISQEQGKLTIRSVEVHYNVALGAGGGGIASRTADLLINPGTQLYYNQADVGGGIAVFDGGFLHINNARVNHNTAVREGGGIAAYPGDTLRVSAINGKIDSNAVIGAEGKGGGIYLVNCPKTSITRCTLIGNRATGSGGGIWSADTYLHLKNLQYNGNVCMGNGPDAGGGAIYNSGGYLYIDDPKFVNNHALGERGSGGAIYCINSNMTLRSAGYLRDNTCQGRGGALCLVNGDVSMSSKDFINNGAFGPYGEGGAIYVQNSRFSLSRADIRLNAAGSKGGGMYIGSGCNASVSSSNIIDNVVLSDMTAQQAAMGGGIYHEADTLDLRKNTISNNSVLGDQQSEGGGLYGKTSIPVRVFTSTISGNTTTGIGGGIAGSTALDLLLSTVIFNQSYRGGGIVQHGASTTLQGTAVSDNSAGTTPEGRVTTDLYTTGGSLTSAGYNLFGHDPNITVLRRSTDLWGMSGKYGPLQHNGGYTYSHEPLPGSPVINKGYPTSSGNYIDQIGRQPSGGRREIGAVEITLPFFFADFDSDGFGDPNQSVQAKVAPEGYISENTDNCPLVSNPSQSDGNRNGVGDACE